MVSPSVRDLVVAGKREYPVRLFAQDDHALPLLSSVWAWPANAVPLATKLGMADDELEM